MSEKEEIYQGEIHADYRKKTLLKGMLIALVSSFFVAFILMYYFIPVFILELMYSISGVNAISMEPFQFYTGFLLIFVILLEVTYIYNRAQTRKLIRDFYFKIITDSIIISHRKFGNSFHKRRLEIYYDQIKEIRIVQGLVDRKFNLYTIKIFTESRGLQPEGIIPGQKEPEILIEKISRQGKIKIEGRLDRI
jgi:membrane protein YdbS with pleckstrin-like domain